MTTTQPTLASLAKSLNIRALEDRWLSAIEDGDARDDMLDALAELTRAGKGDVAAGLGSTWLSMYKESAAAEDVLALAREIVLRTADTEDMRKELVRLYETVHGNRPELPQLLEVSGLRGGKSPRRALRTLEIGLNTRVGDFLISRSDEHVVRVTAIDTNTLEFTVQGKRGVSQTFDPDALAMAYDPVNEGDFRVLIQLQPERITEMLEKDPVNLVIGILHSHRGRMDSDQLEHALVPSFLPPARWKDWWSKAKTALKRCSNIVLEGRNPIILTYTADGQTLEEEFDPQWGRAETPAQRLSVIESYFREAKARGTEPKAAFIKRLQADLTKRISAARRGAPDEALIEALVLQRLAQLGNVTEGETIARDILAESPDLPGLLRQIEENTFFVRALDLVKEIRPEEWPDIFAQLLPVAPQDGCEAIAKALDAAGHRDKLDAAVAQVPTDFTKHIDAVCWLWRGSSVPGIEPLPSRELLLRMFNHLAELSRSDRTPADVLRDTRVKIRNAVSAAKYSRYRQVIEGMDPGLASTVRRTIDRLDGLGQVVKSTLLNIIRDTHPELYVKARTDPWLDESIIFGTQAGLQKREEELNYLINVKMKENAKAIGEAAAHGDLSENSEYKFALEERDLLRARVAQIQNELSMARLLTREDVQTDTVTVGTRVTLASTDGEVRKTITILGPFDADIERGIYNYRAPLCSKLRGLSVGDTAVLDLDGREREFRVEAIENALDD